MRLIVLGLLAVGCAQGHVPPDAASRDAGQAMDASPRDGGRDAGRDAAVPRDGGRDAGRDGASGAGRDAGGDGGLCASPLTRCSQGCVDLRSSNMNCGSCDRVCPTGSTCSSSDCQAPAATWTTNATAYPCATPGVVGMRYSFRCPPGGTRGSVWGTGTYTHDSSICTAAVHAGRITLASGGLITIEMRAGRASYAASTRNGITSGPYGSWTCSFAVVGPPCPVDECNDVCADRTSDHDYCGSCTVACGTSEVCSSSMCECASGTLRCGGSCVDTSTSPMHCGGCGIACDATQVCTGSCTCPPGRTTCGSTCADLTSDPLHCGSCPNACTGGLTCASSTCQPRAAAWTTNATAHDCATPGVIGSDFAYRCPAGGSAGSVWGTDLYTHDSSICTAAVHAGRITLAAGGDVVIRMQAGASSYAASTRNGITSLPYGAWTCSYSFP